MLLLLSMMFAQFLMISWLRSSSSAPAGVAVDMRSPIIQVGNAQDPHVWRFARNPTNAHAAIGGQYKVRPCCAC